MSKKKVYVSNSHRAYSHYYDWLTGMDLIPTRSIFEADIVIFTGGEDINPSLYNQPVGQRTWYNDNRDIVEVADFQIAQKYGKICLGICRGAQLICALSSGSLIQHTTFHAGHPHLVEFENGDYAQTSSLHHQMLYPFDLPKEDYKVLGWTPKSKSDTYLNGLDQEINLPEDFKELEVVWFTKTRGFAVQGHPEMMGPNTSFTKILSKYFIELTNINEDVANESTDSIQEGSRTGAAGEG